MKNPMPNDGRYNDGRNQVVYGGSSPFITPLTEERAFYNEVIADYAALAAFRSGQNRIIPTRGEIRSEVILNPAGAVARNTIEWNIRVDQPNPTMPRIRDTENRLDTNDAFAVMEWGVFFGAQPAPNAGDGRITLHQFENPLIFPTAFNAIGTAYNGTIDMEVNSVKYLDKVGASVTRFVDQAQQGVAYIAAGPALNQIQRSTFERGRGFVKMLPKLTFSGQDKVQWQLNMPQAEAFTEANVEITAVLILRGLKIQNGATFRPGK